MTSAEVAESAGVSLEEARRLWRALGFPDAGDEAAFTDADRQALSWWSAPSSEGGIDFDTAVRLTRAWGRPWRGWRTGRWPRVSRRSSSSRPGRGDRQPGGQRVRSRRGRPFEQLLVYAWRRHLAAAVGPGRGWLGADEDELRTTQGPSGSPTWSRFTALSNGMDEDKLGDLVEIFESAAPTSSPAHGGRVIKTLGDSVLFVADDAVVAIGDRASAIVEMIGARARPARRTASASRPGR